MSQPQNLLQISIYMFVLFWAYFRCPLICWFLISLRVWQQIYTQLLFWHCDFIFLYVARIYKLMNFPEHSRGVAKRVFILAPLLSTCHGILVRHIALPILIFTTPVLLLAWPCTMKRNRSGYLFDLWSTITMSPLVVRTWLICNWKENARPEYMDACMCVYQIIFYTALYI